MQCPLCGHSAAHPYHSDRHREYLQCANCALVFVPARYHLTPKQERDYYDLHENSLEDEGYRRFLSRCATPLLAAIKEGSRGLDFGCGAAPLLAQILSEAGHQMAVYDCYYAADETVLSQRYDFIASTEVVEHLAAPGQELQRLWDALNCPGVLALMTKLVVSQERFAQWHYIRDPTHICFFSRTTFEWLAREWGATLEFHGADVIFLHKH